MSQVTSKFNSETRKESRRQSKTGSGIESGSGSGTPAQEQQLHGKSRPQLSLWSPLSLRAIWWISLEQVASTIVVILISVLQRDVINGAVQGRPELFRNVYLLYLPGILVAGFVLFPIVARLAGRYKFELEQVNTLLVFRHIVRLPVKDVAAGHSGDFISQLTNDLGEFHKFYTRGLGNILFMLLSGVGAFIVMLMISWQISLVMLGLSLVIMVFSALISKRLKDLMDGIQTEKSVTTQSLVDVIRAVPLMKMYRGMRRFTDKFVQSQESLAEQTVYRHWIRCRYQFIYTFTNTSRSLVILVLGLFVFKIPFGSIMVLMLLTSLVQQLMTDGADAMLSIQACLVARDRIMATLERPVEDELESARASVGGSEGVGAVDSRAVIEFRDLSFSYDGERQALQQVNLTVQENEFVGIVGAIGSGKSTLLKLLMGFYRTEQGEVKVLGRRRSEFSRQEFFDQVAYVDQRATLFAGTIFENIACWRDDVTLAQVREAARGAHIDEFISTLPEGYQTQVGEMGSRLSGGQRQRIAIARALLKDAPILLMDEATSALDQESEVMINQVIRELKGRKTIVVIAHRLSTIAEADRIYVLRDGQVVEDGCWAELERQDGLFAQLVQSQYGAE